MQNQNTEQLRLAPPSLPSGGGAISGLKGNIAAAAPDGAATLSIPIPVSAGRGYAPSLMLSYHSRNGNGVFGMGWGLNLSAIRLRTHKGVPSYDGTDEYTGPDGEVLVPVLTDDGKPETRTTTMLLSLNLGSTFTVSAYRSRIETTFSKLELWTPEKNTDKNFWVIYEPDGQVHLFGRNTQARISHPADPSQTAVWLLESSVSPNGEQIYRQYRAEDDAGCDATEISSHPGVTAQRYPVAVWYGNKKAGRTLPGLVADPVATDWLFFVVTDYGERGTDPATAPAWKTPGNGDWLCRQDSFSGYEYGFAVRTRRLCRQVLVFHRIAVLSGEEKSNADPELVSRILLNYDETPAISTLTRVQQMAYGSDGKVCKLPPLTFGWQSFTPPTSGDVMWQLREDMNGFNLQQPYQVVDLNGEGIAGILYQDGNGWQYRAPKRLAGAETDAVTWENSRVLPFIPGLREGATLADINGDGYLEWVVTTPGIAGSYERTPNQEWQRFIPLATLPAEYFHPHALLTDITGSGFSDLALIGPKSVRFYSGNGEGWTKAQNAMQAAGVTLPVPGTDARVMVAFSDMAGSGQQHLTEIRAEGVRYWPNLGHGHFGPPVHLSGFSQPPERFNPEQLYLADIDGSGTTDLVYVLGDGLEIYINQSGNRFAAPFKVNLPDGVHYGLTCSLQLADIQGLGVASLILTIPHPTPRSWICHLSEQKPWLLNKMNNSMGANHTLFYRSSAQFWLDEKALAIKDGIPVPVCYLPFSLQTLRQTVITDEISGNQLCSTIRYRHGVWDGREKEFRGFSFVEISDTDITAGRGTSDVISHPSVSRNWYASGMTAVDKHLPDEYWKGDAEAFDHFISRFTTGNGEEEQVYILNAFTLLNDPTLFWLNRGQKGMLLRSELYGADNSHQATIPYTVTENRPQVRLIEKTGTYPVVWPVMAENRTYTYERVSSDPQCSQQILLFSDKYGQPMKQVTVSYPRRNQVLPGPYPDTLPDGLFSASFDEQQQTLYLTVQQFCWHTLTNTDNSHWVTGLAKGVRQNIFIDNNVPEGGVTLEYLLSSNSPIDAGKIYTFAGQQRTGYWDLCDKATTDIPAFPPRQAFTETAVLDENMINLSSVDLSEDELIQKGGYRATDYLFPQNSEKNKNLLVVRRGYTTYAPAEHFYLPVVFSNTLLTGAMTVIRDTHDCVITQQKDAAELTTTAEYDWRFLTPIRVIDVNDNIQAVTMDALGRVTTLRFCGTESGVITGYSDAKMDIPESAEAALAFVAPLPVTQCIVYVTDSWVRPGAEKLPPHVVTLSTDRYDSDNKQQIRQQVTFSDGFGRVLQVATRQENGEAWQLTENGSLVMGTDETPAVTKTAFRWGVTGRTEYDNKGQVVRTYQPYFLDSWKYVCDDRARKDLYADTHYYDPVGREWQVKTAKGWLRQTLFMPWFVVYEDENNTQT